MLGRYELGARLAAGSLGTVVAATDRRTGRAVAVKFFDGAQDNYAAWVDEMRLAVRLEHPHIAACLDAGHDERWGLSVLVFARALGGSLRRALASGRRFAAAEIHRLLVELAGALWHAHARGVVHRDVKPENILALEVPGEPPWALTDFGAGRFLARGARMRSLAGSREYMAPELLLDGADASSDQYSLGIVALELHAGERPGLTARSEFRLRHRGRGGLLAVIACLTDPDPLRRFPSCEALLRALAVGRGGFDVTRTRDGAAYLLAGDEVALLRPGASGLARAGRVPRARRFVHEADEPAVIVAGDRRVVELGGPDGETATTLLAGDLGFETFVASRRHRAIWLLRGDELACADLAGEVRGLRVVLPTSWSEALAERAPLAGATLSPTRAVLGVLGCDLLLLARRDELGVHATLLRAPGPLQALQRSGDAVALLCGDAREASLLRAGPDGLTPLEHVEQPVDHVRIAAGPAGPILASLLVSGHELAERRGAHA